MCTTPIRTLEIILSVQQIDINIKCEAALTVMRLKAMGEWIESERDHKSPQQEQNTVKTLIPGTKFLFSPPDHTESKRSQRTQDQPPQIICWKAN